MRPTKKAWSAYERAAREPTLTKTDWMGVVWLALTHAPQSLRQAVDTFCAEIDQSNLGRKAWSFKKKKPRPSRKAHEEAVAVLEDMLLQHFEGAVRVVDAEHEATKSWVLLDIQNLVYEQKEEEQADGQ